MQFLICAATELEIESTKAFIEHHQFAKEKVSILITGVGLTACTYSLTKAIVSNRPQFVLQAGICGSLDSVLAPGDLVVVENETIGDLGVVEKGSFTSLFAFNFMNKNEEPWANGHLPNNLSLLRKTSLKIVNGVTVNEITTDLRRIDFYKNKLHANIETMEGAALHYVCLKEKIPFLQLRSISNFVGERDKQKWTIKESVLQLNIELQKMILKLSGV
ncbi:MAG TPA: futalosine hydrolase [Chitinophagaceae bacterium]|jgi:futalosine hydrolase|nr:futalosine hydrolase [Chitinophagaceae bacterium]